MSNQRFEVTDFRASRTECGDILIDDSPNGWKIALLEKDIPAFLQWLTSAAELPSACEHK